MTRSATRPAPSGRASGDRANLYDEITDRIIAELEAGRLPWVQPWGTSGVAAPLALPKNAATGRRYSGINVLILWGAVVERGYAGQSWLTFRQALALGGNVRKGERGTTVVYADRFIPGEERQRAEEKRLARTAPIPCIIRTEGIAEEDSLAENVQRAPLHPLDQFRAFQALRERGRSEEEIAAAFFVSVGVVRQRLRLAAVSPRLLDLYAEDGMTLEQLMAFTVSPDHERQEQVWEALQRAYTKEPYQIRRLLTEGAVRASDNLDMAAVGWRPTAEAYLGRVTKGRILVAVREARGARAAERIAGLKKAEMATAAEELLAGTGWVPEPLRTPGQVFAAVEPETEAAAEGEAESAADGGEPAIAPEFSAEDTEAVTTATAIAAE